MVTGLDHAIITMKKGETGLFTLPPELGYGAAGRGDIIPPNSVVQFEVELVSWITVVDVSRDSGIIKKIMEKGEGTETPGDLDEVLGTLRACYVIILLFIVTISNDMRIVSMPSIVNRFCLRGLHMVLIF